MLEYATDYPSEVILAAILHDVIEDGEVTENELARRFGRTVADLVAEVTDPPGLPEAHRRARQVLKAGQMTAHARRLKIADKISNVRDVVEHRPAGWHDDDVRAYVEWGRLVVDECRAADPELAARFDPLYLRTVGRVAR
jgi:GTP diphosphokinase / guanosine-3',5'-bis(diphosphate) 3'-diphosphatase